MCLHAAMYGAVCYIHDMHALSRYVIDCTVLNNCSMLLSAWHNHNAAVETFLQIYRNEPVCVFPCKEGTALELLRYSVAIH